MSETSCGNPRHPNGAWHPATPHPLYSWRNRREVKAFEKRREANGCGCLVTTKEQQP